jgi:ribulose-5-phosphate 4-epimerase/fuculose-1-phosphate aldolase
MNEAEARCQLALAFRWAARLDFAEGTCNHFSVALAGGRTLINPFGLHFSEIRPRDLLLVDESGQVLEGAGMVEATAFHIHSRLHRARPSAICVLHTHMPYATALTATAAERLEPCHQNALRFFGRAAYDDPAGGYGGLALDSSEGDRMAAALGDADILLLRSHGVIVAGPSIARAFDDLYYLERAAKIQVLAMSTGKPLGRVGDNLARQTAEEFSRGADAYATAHFAALQRLMDRDSPGWAD